MSPSNQTVRPNRRVRRQPISYSPMNESNANSAVPNWFIQSTDTPVVQDIANQPEAVIRDNQNTFIDMEETEVEFSLEQAEDSIALSAVGISEQNLQTIRFKIDKEYSGKHYVVVGASVMPNRDLIKDTSVFRKNNVEVNIKSREIEVTISKVLKSQIDWSRSQDQTPLFRIHIQVADITSNDYFDSEQNIISITTELVREKQEGEYFPERFGCTEITVGTHPGEFAKVTPPKDSLVVATGVAAGMNKKGKITNLAVQYEDMKSQKRYWKTNNSGNEKLNQLPKGYEKSIEIPKGSKSAITGVEFLSGKNDVVGIKLHHAKYDSKLHNLGSDALGDNQPPVYTDKWQSIIANRKDNKADLSYTQENSIAKQVICGIDLAAAKSHLGQMRIYSSRLVNQIMEESSTNSQ